MLIGTSILMCLLFSFNLVFPISGYFPSWPCPATCSTCSACQRPRASRSFRSSRSSPKQKEPRRARYVSKGKLGVLNMCQKENKHFDERETPMKSETGKGKREVHTVHCVLHSAQYTLVGSATAQCASWLYRALCQCQLYHSHNTNLYLYCILYFVFCIL